MYLTEAITIKLKCSDFMLKSEHCNDDTVFAVFDSSLRTHDFYLILSFIYSKYKDSISNKKYLTEIENYIKLFNTDSGIDSDMHSDELVLSVLRLEKLFYYDTIIDDVNTSIDDFLNVHNCSNAIIINKESHHKNEYTCYIKE
jgi:hypothetical protein